jgi:hypothetical protein
MDEQEPNVRLVASGPSFELWKAPRGAMRLDWNRRAIVRMIVRGHGYGEYAAPELRRWTDALRLAPQIGLVIDFGDMESYDSQLRSEMQGWAARHRSSVELVYVYSKSRIVNMGVAVANLAVGGIIKAFATKHEFDMECQKLGLPINPSMTSGHP